MTVKQLIHELQNTYNPNALVRLDGSTDVQCGYYNSNDLGINETPTQDYFALWNSSPS